MMKKTTNAIALLLGLIFIIIYLWPAKKYKFYEITDAYRTEAENYDVPSMPDGWQWREFTAKDGTKIRWGLGADIENPKATLFIIPGFTSTLELYGETARHWQDQGYRVAGIDPRGQGGSERVFEDDPDKPFVKDFGVYIDDLDQFLKQHRDQFSRPLIIVGMSMGSHIGFRTLGEKHPDVDGLVMIAPALRPRTNPVSFKTAKLIGFLARVFNKEKNYTLGQSDWVPEPLDDKREPYCSNDFQRLNRYSALMAIKPELRAGGATNGWLSAFMRSNDKITKPGFYSKIDKPVMMIHASDDLIVVPEIAKAVCDDMQVCQQLTIPNSRHCLPMETDAVLSQVYTSIDALVERVITK